MQHKSLLLLLVVGFLSACAPKYNYVNERVQNPEFDRSVVVFDYLHFVDDVGKLLDYHAEKNQTQIERMKQLIERQLKLKGYAGRVDFAMISSGVGLNPEVAFEHYSRGKLQEELIYPPFYIDSPHHLGVQDQLMQSFNEAQGIAFVPVSKKNQTFFNDLRLPSVYFTADENGVEMIYPDDAKVGVLHVRAIMPRVSFMKQMGVSVLTVGLTMGATGGAYVGIAVPMGTPHSTIVLFDNSTGEVIWKNQRPGDLSRYKDKFARVFFDGFPATNP